MQTNLFHCAENALSILQNLWYTNCYARHSLADIPQVKRSILTLETRYNTTNIYIANKSASSYDFQNNHLIQT
jgi:hypothetical protein